MASGGIGQRDLSARRIIGFACNQAFMFFALFMSMAQSVGFATGQDSLGRMGLLVMLAFMVVGFALIRLLGTTRQPRAFARPLLYIYAIVAAVGLLAPSLATQLGVAQLAATAQLAGSGAQGAASAASAQAAGVAQASSAGSQVANDLVAGAFPLGVAAIAAQGVLVGVAGSLLLTAWGRAFSGVDTKVSVPEVFLGSLVGALVCLAFSLGAGSPVVVAAVCLLPIAGVVNIPVGTDASAPARASAGRANVPATRKAEAAAGHAADKGPASAKKEPAQGGWASVPASQKAEATAGRAAVRKAEAAASRVAVRKAEAADGRAAAKGPAGAKKSPVQGDEKATGRKMGSAPDSQQSAQSLSAKMLAGTLLFGAATGLMLLYRGADEPALASYQVSMVLYGAFLLGALTLLLSDGFGRGAALNKSYRLAVFVLMMGVLLVPWKLLEGSVLPGESVVLAGSLGLQTVLISLFLVLAELTGADCAQSFSTGFLALFAGELVGALAAAAIAGAEAGEAIGYATVVLAGACTLLGYVFLFTERDFDELSQLVTEGDSLEQTCADLTGRFGLSNRESEILAFALRGRTSERIAQELVISKSTVDTHLRRIYAKCGVHSRQELLDLAGL